MLCPNHHLLVDSHPELYPSEKLKEFKREHETRIEKRPENIALDSLPRFQLLAELVDQKIEKEVNTLRESRFLKGFDRVGFSLEFVKQLVEGKFSWGTDIVRSRALAWCVRILSLAEDSHRMEEYLDIAKTLEVCEETKIAEAFLHSRRGDKNSAKSILSDIDSPMSRSAAFMIARSCEGEKGAIEWLGIAGVNITDLDSDGKASFLTCQLKLANWDEARSCLDALNDEDMPKAPVLYYLKGIIYLLGAVPDDLRTSVWNQVPLRAATFPLASDAIRECWEAHRCFVEATEAAKKLNCLDAAKISEEYALWLELRNLNKADERKQLLQARLCNLESSLHLVRLGFDFGLSLDVRAIEREIERQTAVCGKVTRDAASARFALALCKETPEDVANHIDRYQAELLHYYDEKFLQFLKIDMLFKAGLIGRANECLADLEKEELPANLRNYLKTIIVEAEENNPVETRRRRFEETNSVGDLIDLVEELEDNAKWDELCEYAQVLFEETHDARHAEKLTIALSQTRRNEQMLEFIEANAKLLEQSEKLRMLYSVALYNNGALLESRSKFKELACDMDDANYRTLRIKLAVSLGDQDELLSIVATEYLERGKRNARHLISIAEIAVRLGLPNVKELTIAAVEKDPDDAHVLAAAHLLATESGWEDDARAQAWLEKAALLSGDDGPIQPVSLKDLLDRRPEWNQRSSDFWQQLVRGDTPMFLAAQALRKSLADFTLFPAWANLSENDPRRRSTIPAYSGNRRPTLIDTAWKIGIDPTALLTLSFLGLLNKALEVFDKVYVAHSTLAWLFEEKQRAKFHQPSRMKNAREVLDLIATGRLEKLEASTCPDSDLSAKIGDDLATLIAEAEKTRDGDNTQRIVVRSYPVYLSASLINEEADLSAHSNVLRSCQSVILKLKQKGQITDEMESQAYDYLKLMGKKSWPNEEEIVDGAILYLDDLSVTCFLHLGMLEKLHAAGFRPFVSPRTVFERRSLLSRERVSADVVATIENIRTSLNSRINEGRIEMSRRLHPDEPPQEETLCTNASVGLFALANDCDAVISDDRFFNRNEVVDNGNSRAPVFSTLDILDTLASSDSITPQKRRECRTRLRAAGYFFVPVSEEELKLHLDDSPVQDNEVVEKADLKAIRENILCAQMNDWLQFPREWFWVDMSLKAFIRVLKNLWAQDVELADAWVRSDWVLGQVNIGGWARSLAHKNRDDIIRIESARHFMTMFLPPSGDMSRKIQEEYWDWFEGRILRPIREQYPDLYLWTAKWHKEQIAKISETAPAEIKAKMDSPRNKAKLALETLSVLPPLLRSTLLADETFREDYELTENVNVVFSFGTPVFSAIRSNLFGAVRKVLSGASVADVTDIKGRKWDIKNTSGKGGLPRLALLSGEEKHYVPHSCISLSPDRETRLRFIEEAASALNLPGGVRDEWRNILVKSPLEDEEVDAIHKDFLYTPVAVIQSMNGGISGGDVPFLVCDSRKYFDRLVGKYDGSVSVQDYATGGGRALLRELSDWKPYEGFLLSLYLSSHSALTAEINVDGLGEEDLVRAYGFLEKHGDRISQMGAIEVGFRILPSNPGIEPLLVRLIKQIRDDDVEGKASGFRFLSDLFRFVDGRLSGIRLFSSEPPFYRKFAALSHAALIHSQLVNLGIERDLFDKCAFEHLGWQHLMQSFFDMRTEPHWNLVLDTAGQMKLNFVKRIMASAEEQKQNIKSEELLGLVFGTDQGSICSGIDFFRFDLPGLLECDKEPLQDLPADISDAITTQIDADEVSPLSFVTLLNSVRIFRLGPEHAELAAKALRSCEHRLANIEDRTQLRETLSGLATVTAVTRNLALADELRITVRRYRDDVQYHVSGGEEIMICLMSAASHEDMNDWMKFVGDWMTELAFVSDIKDDEIDMLLLSLQSLCRIAPDLWSICGKAYAALGAYSKSIAREQKSHAQIDYKEPVNEEVRLILDGESKVVEFKSTLRYDLSTKKVNKKLEYVVAKTIAAFLNSEGGDLFIGIDDHKNALGLSKDMETLKKKSVDGFELQLVQVIKQYIGGGYMSHIKITFFVYDDKEVCRVRVEKSGEPVFTKFEGREDFFARLGCSSQPLSREEQSRYEKEHWGPLL